MPTVLGVRIDDIGKTEAKQRVSDMLTGDAASTVFTPNPEMVVLAGKDEAFKQILNTGTLNICDGKGLQMFGGIKNRIQGTDFVLDICELAAEQGKSVYLLGTGSEERLQKARERLFLAIPNLRIAGWHVGPQLTSEGVGDSQQVIDDIVRRAPDNLFVAFGHGKQEYWIRRNLKHLPSVRVAMGVGGALDFISGSIPRAPAWMRTVGLEWFWRLLIQPKRIGRILTATIVFPFLCLRSRSKK